MWQFQSLTLGRGHPFIQFLNMSLALLGTPIRPVKGGRPGYAAIDYTPPKTVPGGIPARGGHLLLSQQTFSEPAIRASGLTLTD